MGRYKKIGILLAVLIVVLSAAFGISRYEEKKELIKNSDEIILEIDSETVNSLSWEYESEQLSFHKDEKWLYDEDDAFPVDEEKIADLLSIFQEFGVSFIIEEVEDYGQYGLDDPVCKICFATDETSYEVLLGDFSTMDSERYVSIGDGKVYLVKNDPLDYFDAVLSDVIKHDESLSYDEITEIRFSGSSNNTILYEEESADTYCADDVYFLESDKENLPLDTSRVNSYLETISYLNLVNYVTYNATEEELENYGMNDPELTVAVDYNNYVSEESEEKVSDTYVLHISRSLEDREKDTGEASKEAEQSDEDSEAADEEFTAYARVGDSQIIYEIGSVEYMDIMNASYDSLRHLSVFSAAFEDIDQIDITLEGTDYTISTAEDDDTKTYYYQDEEVDISNFKLALKGLSSDKFTTEKPDQKEEISLVLHLDNENYPEVEVKLYRYDGSYCLAAVDGEAVSLVSRSDSVNLIEAVNAIVLD